MRRLTKARLRALEYVRDNEPVKLFPVQGPSLSLVRKMASEGYFRVEVPSAFGFSRYLLTDAGRAALQTQTPPTTTAEGAPDQVASTEIDYSQG